MAKEVIYEVGLQEVYMQVWDDINEEYVGDLIAIPGEHKLTYKRSDTHTALASGDNPGWAVVAGATKYEGTVSIYALSQELKRKLFAVLLSKAGGLLLGDTNATPRFVGIMGDSRVVENGVTTINRIVFYKALFEEPEVTNESSDEDGPNTADLEIDFTAYPVPYLMEDGSYAGRCGVELNSADQPTAFASFSKGLSAPTAAELADLIED